MKKLFITLLIFSTAISLSSQSKRPMTIDDLWAMKRIKSYDVSVDGKLIVFQVETYDMETNTKQNDIWLINSDGTNLRPLKNSESSETNPSFTPNGELITYQLDGQIRQCSVNGENDIQLTDLYTGASNIKWSVNVNKFLFLSEVYPDCETQECNKTKDDQKATSKVNVIVAENLMFRHWDSWRSEKRTHLFLMDTESNKYFDLANKSKHSIPTEFLGSGNDYNFSPSGNEIAFSANFDEVKAVSTNNDIFTLDLDEFAQTGELNYKKISASGGSDTHPVYSPDGKYIAYKSMNRAGFEADKQHIILYDRDADNLIRLSEKYDVSVDAFIWSPDSKFLYFTADNTINKSIYKIDVSTGNLETIVEENVNSGLQISSDGNILFFKRQSTTMPEEIFSLNLSTNEIKQITSLNETLLSKIEFGTVETFWSKGALGENVQSILIKPPKFDSTKKYPMIFLVHGGPQGNWADDFHYRWNLQLFASRGHVVVAPNPRGSTGYGQDFTDAITQNWGYNVFTDLMNAYDYAIEHYPFIDGENTFTAGASYGGYMMAWIAGHTDRFNAIFYHDGLYNLESFWGTTEELWFPQWEFGGTPWENKELYKKMSPSSYVENFKTPILVSQGGKDYRVPDGQAFEFFTALQRQGVESKLIYFPEENHFVLKPQNSKFWWNTLFNWFDKYTVRE